MHRPSTLGYRPDIDGLRAIAILAIVAFHVGIGGLPGAFTGVDVFFVISGFLITSLMIGEAERTGTIGLAAFYARRIKRLLPAFAIVTLATLAAGSVLLAKNGELQSLADSALAALCLMANQYFRHLGGYFALPLERQPLLHYWSLSVEEQFYLVAPISVAAVFRLSRGISFRRRLGLALVFAWLVSFVLNVWLVHSNKGGAAFYLMPPRAWELATGGLLAVPRPAQWRRVPVSVAAAASAVGVAAIVGGLTLINGRDMFPGALALLPTIGAAALIASVSISSATVVGRALSHRVAVWFGLISYPWYLWHWPFLTLARVTRGPDFGRDCALAIVSLIVAALTYYAVEKPIQRRAAHWRRPGPVVLAGVASLAVLALCSRALVRWADNGAAAERSTVAWVVASNDQSRVWEHCQRDVMAADLPLDECFRARGTPRRVVVVWGDSHAASLMPIADRLLDTDSNVAVLEAAKSTCPGLLGVTPWNRAMGAPHECGDFTARVQAELIALRNQGYPVSVLMVSRWAGYLGTSQIRVAGERTFLAGGPESPDAASLTFRAALRRTLAFLRAQDVRIAVVLPVAEFPYPAPECLRRWRRNRMACGVERRRFDAFADPATKIIVAEAAGAGDVRLIDPLPLVCDSAYCYPSRGDLIYYFDDNHLSTLGALALYESNASLRTWLDDR